MTLHQIAALAAGGESETLEFKTATNSWEAAIKAVCAMLNHRGGQVIFGVKPDGEIVGQEVSDHTIEELAGKFRLIEPPSFPEIERIPAAAGRQVIVVNVANGKAKPYAYKGVSYRRVGNTNQPMSGGQANRMLLERVHSQQRWENEAADGWGVADLDADAIRSTVEAAVYNGRLSRPAAMEPESLLRGLGLIKDGALLRAGVVLFGDNRRLEREMTQCLLRVARFRGVSKSEFLDNRQFHGNAFTLLEQAQRFLYETLPIAGRVTAASFQREDFPVYPPDAVREALANAICHRDYSFGGGSLGVAVYDDRLEITSPGELHFDLTPEKLFAPHESRPWNPLIASVFYRHGIIEQWGGGTLKMAELTEAAGLPRPEIEEIGGGVAVRFRPSRYIPPQRVAQDLTERQREILALLNRAGPGLALREVCRLLNQEDTISERQVRVELYALKTLGQVVSAGWGRGARWRLA